MSLPTDVAWSDQDKDDYFKENKNLNVKKNRC